MFSLNSIGCVTKCGPAGILREITYRCMVIMLKSSYRKIWSNILTARWRASAWSDKMNKEQSADDPSVDLIRVKNMLNSTISMSYPDVVIACIEHKVTWKHSEQLRQRWWSTIIIWRIILGGWLITITANHSNYLVCDRANTQSVNVRKVVNQINYCNALVIKHHNIVLFGGRTRDVHSSSLLIDVYALFSDVSLRRQASMTQAEKFPDPFCSRAMLICSIIC